jgi:uncharacterized membrane protein YdjX (TVP38/TMEM64 family)
MDWFHLTQTLVEFLRRWGEMSPSAAAVLALVFIAGGLVPVPRTFFSIAAGVVFGMASIPVILPATAIGALLAFLLARYFFAERLWRTLERRPKALAIMNAVDAEGWRIVALCRLASPIPSTIQSAMFGLTHIALWPYLWATFVFTIPLTILYVYLGAVGKAALTDETASAANLGVMLAGGLIFLAIVLMITRRVRTGMRNLEAEAASSAR